MTEALTPAEADARWACIVNRSTTAGGEFYFSVSTTGIYCRPSCKSRLPRRENVRFHATRADAEAAGFRPCKRCRPEMDMPEGTDAARIEAACQVIAAAGHPVPTPELARQAGMSTSLFHRLFKTIIGVTPGQYSAAQRAQRVRQELQTGGRVIDALYNAGFQSSGRFYERAAEMLGMTPARYRAGGAGITILHATATCRLGHVLVARADRGVCAILLGDDTEALTRDLEVRFPAAKMQAGDADFTALVAAVARFVDEPAGGLDLPLDMQGTVFQQKVWRALRNIPPGRTATYTEIAARIGAPKAARAVAGACAANALAVAIPCHRVVRGDGSLSGYRWGVERKRALLELENVACAIKPSPGADEAPESKSGG